LISDLYKSRIISYQWQKHKENSVLFDSIQLKFLRFWYLS